MSIGSVTVAAAITDDATYRAWIQSVHDALAAAGLVQTADSGQINIATVVRPAASSAAPGSGIEVWRFNDSLQATAPLFVKIGYGVTGTAPPTSPVLFVQVGKGSDGAGNLTGLLVGTTGMRTVNRGQSLTAGSLTFASHADGTMALVTDSVSPADTFRSFGFVVDRWRNADGTPNGEGILYMAQGSAWEFIPVEYATALFEIGPSPSALTPVSASAGASLFKGETLAYPIYPVLGYPRAAASLGAVLIVVGDVGPNVAFQLPLFGANHTFRAVVASGLLARNNASGSSYYWAVRYE